MASLLGVKVMGCNSLFGVETHTYVQEKNRENFSSINDGHFGKKTRSRVSKCRRDRR